MNLSCAGDVSLRLALVAAFLAAAPVTWAKEGSADSFPSDVASVWFDMLYDVVRSEGTTPPPASRIYGVSAVGLYESIVSGTEENRSLVGQLNDLSEMPEGKKKNHWPTVANAVLAQAIRGIFTSLKPENLDAINALEADFNALFQGQQSFDRSVAFGKEAADAVLAWAATDGFAELNNSPYVPAPVAGAWEPTPPAFSTNPLQARWGQIRPMVLTSGADCAPPGHPEFSSDTASQLHATALEVYNVGINLNDEQKTIADYWADGPVATGTPPGHWIALVGQFARNDALSLTAAAEAYARVGIAVHDAFIECWHFKYETNLQRPVTYINDNIDASWVPYIATPPFPTYPSGHSTQSGAAAVLLTDMFGIRAFIDTIRTDHDLGLPDEPRSFASFDHAAYEAAVSRLYGGIHYTFDNQDGLLNGRCIGHTIVRKVSFKKESKKDKHDH
jgi:hypothetical protein